MGDLEALGWLLASGLFQTLPWFARLTAAYPNWHEESIRQSAVRDTQQAKSTLLDHGWRPLGEWNYPLDEFPRELYRFINACRQVVPPKRPDYVELSVLLGGHEDANAEEAEKEDLRQWQEIFSTFHV